MRKCRKIYVYYLKIKITTVQTNHTDCNGQYYVKKSWWIIVIIKKYVGMLYYYDVIGNIMLRLTIFWTVN